MKGIFYSCELREKRGKDIMIIIPVSVYRSRIIPPFQNPISLKFLINGLNCMCLFMKILGLSKLSLGNEIIAYSVVTSQPIYNI